MTQQPAILCRPIQSAVDPTTVTYEALHQAYALFNDRLFKGQLPNCLITMQRHAKAYGYFSPSRFGSRDGQNVTDEIALNPAHFDKRTTEQSLSTLAHEMAHLWQHHFGKASRAGYHNKEWALKMVEIGLIPSHTGEPGGKQTGQQMTHYIAPTGPYRAAYAEWLSLGFGDFLVDLWEDAEAKAGRLRKAASKTRYRCPSCDANVWAKPEMRIICGDCDEPFVA